MVWYFVEHSESFDPDGFEKYVRTALLSQAGPEEGLALLAEVEKIAEDRKQAATVAAKKSFISAEGAGACPMLRSPRQMPSGVFSTRSSQAERC